MRSNYLTFEASTLVLDLDAEDSPYVRPYNHHVDGAPTSPKFHRLRERQTMQKRVAEFERLSQEYEERYKMTVSDVFHPWRISDYDILSVALDDSSTSESTLPLPTHAFRHSKLSKSILNVNGVPLLVRNSSSKTIAYMLRRQQLNQRLQSDGTLPVVKSLKDALRRCNNFLEVERLITDVVQTPQGHQPLVDCTPTLGHVLKNMVGITPRVQMLSFLNNITMNLDSHGLHISYSIIALAYELSLQCRTFTATQKYLKMMRDNNHTITNELLSDTVINLRASISETENVSSHARSDTADRLLAIYSLLTGRILGDPLPHASLSDFISTRRNWRLGSYIACLARLGAFRTMWHIWHTWSQSARDTETSCQEGDVSRPDLDDKVMRSTDRRATSDAEDIPDSKFARAIHHAIVGNSQFAEVVQAYDFAGATGQYDEDCQLDMEAIMRSADAISTGGRGQFHRVESEEMSEIFSKSSIGEAMAALQSYLGRIPAPSHVKDDDTSIAEPRMRTDEHATNDGDTVD